MSNLDRRQFLKGLLGSLAQGAGTVVLASAVAKAAGAGQAIPGGPPDIQKRADQLAAAFTRTEATGEMASNEFLNVGWNPGFRNSGWPNGGWRNGNWGNGGWPNLGWRNGSWRNGGWPNGGWRNGGWVNGRRR